MVQDATFKYADGTIHTKYDTLPGDIGYVMYDAIRLEVSSGQP